MSLGSRLFALARRALRSPAVRRTARHLGHQAVDAVQNGRREHPPEAPAADRRSVAGQDPAENALPDRSGLSPLALDHSARDDGSADPGEIVWAWVPYEEDITRGKDRPVLVIARERTPMLDGAGADSTEELIALMLTSRDRGEDVHTGEHGGTWVDIGSGDWDRRGRPSEVRADRLLRLRPSSVRREGAALDRDRFEIVARTVRDVHGWDA